MDRFLIHEPERTSVEGYRVIWYHSTRKTELDALAWYRRLERALGQLAERRRKLASPRSRYRERAPVAQAVETILPEAGVARWMTVEITEETIATFGPQRRGRPGVDTRYVKHERKRFDLTSHLDHARLAEATHCDGIFPRITNDVTWSALELRLASQPQPRIATRFAPLKTDFVAAPVFLKEVSRIQALRCVSFFALLVESLLERELRRAMAREGIESRPLYPEGRACRLPTARRVIDLFEEVQRPELRSSPCPAAVFTTALPRRQCRILRLLGMPNAYDG